MYIYMPVLQQSTRGTSARPKAQEASTQSETKEGQEVSTQRARARALYLNTERARTFSLCLYARCQFRQMRKA